MKIHLILTLCAVALAYDDIGNIDVDAIVADPVQTRKYLDCFTNKGPCTDLMTHIKGHILEATLNSCAKCTPQEKHMAEEFTLNVLMNYPDVMEEIKKIYDPDGSKMKKLVLELSKY